MGNRAVISFDTNKSSPCIYLHWNGGRASVEAFLAACMDLGYHNTGSSSANMDQIEEMIRPWFARGNERLSIYREVVGRADCDNYDNGQYIVDPDLLTIKRRLYHRGSEEIDLEKTATIHAEVVAINTAPRCRYECLKEAA